MIAVLLGLLAAAPPVMAVPLPPSPPAPGPAERQAYGDTLRRLCMSEPGIAIVLDHWERIRAVNQARLPRSRAIEQELSAAAVADPIEIDRLAQAMAARRADQTQFFVDSNADSIAVLQALSPTDRQVYARQLAATSGMPQRTCLVPPRP